ncbi:MAG: hypothetical protein R3B81_08370 [bacterium]
MKRSDRTLFALLFAIPVLLVLPFVLIAADSWTPGAIECRVIEKEGGEVGVTIPAMLVPVAIRLAPSVIVDDIRCELDDDARQGIEIARASLRELGKVRDGMLVDIRTNEEIVQVEMKKGTIHIYVDSPDEVVRVAAPISAVNDVLDAILGRVI